MIHPSAIIDSSAEIGSGTTIGPGVLIEGPVRIGPDCDVRAHAVITGHTTIGARNQIGYGAIIGSEPQDLSYKGAETYVRIGDDNTIREYSTIHRGTKEGSATVIGSHCFLMAGAHVAHNCEVQDHVILVNNVLLGGHVLVEERAFLGGAVVVHQNTRIGSMAMARGLTRIGQDVPPYCMAVATNSVCGLNRVGMRRSGMATETRKKVRIAYHLIFSSGLNRQQAVDELLKKPLSDCPEVERMARFLEGTKRGLCRGLSASEAADF